MLPAEQREALILVGAGGFAYEEAAEICGCAVGTVKSRVSRARRALQAALESGALRPRRRARGRGHGLHPRRRGAPERRPVGRPCSREPDSCAARTSRPSASAWRWRWRSRCCRCWCSARCSRSSPSSGGPPTSASDLTAGRRAQRRARPRADGQRRVLLQTLDAPGRRARLRASACASSRATSAATSNLIRFDAPAAASPAPPADVPADARAASAPWFEAPGAAAQPPWWSSARRPALRADALAARRRPRRGRQRPLRRRAGRGDAASPACRPDASRSGPAHGRGGRRWPTRTGQLPDAHRPHGLPPDRGPGFARSKPSGLGVFYGKRRRRPAAGLSPPRRWSGDVFVVLSAPAQGLFSWARLNPFATVVLPLLAFAVALMAVLDRRRAGGGALAALPASGSPRSTPAAASRCGRCRPSNAPPEIRDLAQTLDAMADAIVARDASLREAWRRRTR